MRWNELRAGAEFVARLPFHLHSRVSTREARALLAERLHGRESRFLDRLRHDVFGYPGGVYHQLFRHAGCELGDVEADVRRNGMEEALHRLFRGGVYLTVDEFKGRKPVLRGSLRIDAAPEALRSPRAAFHVLASSGGSRSSGTPVLIDLAFVRDCAANCLLMLEARNQDGREWVKCDYEAIGAGARFRLIKMATFGSLPQAWFSPIDPADPLMPRAFHRNTQALRFAGILAGRPFPTPRHSPLQDPIPICRWIESVRRSGRTAMVFTFAGSAVRICLAAAAKGMDLSGARFLMMGEPSTAARLAAVRKAGCVPIPRYGSIECGAIGYACANAEYPDEMHLLADMHCVIPAGTDGEALGLPPKAVLLTNLHAKSPFLMLNLSMGDQMEFRRRDCGCALFKLGWTTLVHDVRSFEKLTGEGVTFFGTEVIPILEQVLPERFGGGPTDYQLVETESSDGRPLLDLRVQPSLGPLEEAAIADCLLSSLASVSDSAALMARRWKDAGTLRVVRRPPLISRAGKILHLHVERKPGQEGN